MVIQRTQKEIRQRAPVWLIALLVLNAGLMSFDARDAVTRERMIRVWAQGAVGWAQRPVSSASGASVGFFQRVSHMWRASAENEDLRRRVAEAENELRDARASRDENERLKGLLDLKQDVNYGTVSARVISRDSSMWFGSVIVNRGTSSGVKRDMPVATREGLVGRVVGVSPWTAQVMLLTDERAAAGAVVGQLGDSGALGSVRGRGQNGLLRMGYVSGLVQVNLGDYVVTTGQDGIYPPGLNVGTVEKITPGSATTAHEIFIKPGARLDSLQEVMILQYQPPPRAARMETLPNVDKGKK